MAEEEITLKHLAAEIAQLRQQLELFNRRLDMIYGAVTRLADQSGPGQAAPAPSSPRAQSGSGFPAAALMDPGSMLDALHQYATDSGLDISIETVERLKKDASTEATRDEE